MSTTPLPLSAKTNDASTVDQNEPLQMIVKEIVRVALPDQVILFGSRAKRTASKESDYDFLVVVSGIHKERQVSRRIYRAFLDRRVGVAVDVVVVGTETLDQHRSNPYFIYRQAVEEGQIVYARPRV